jgi:hypothetical protein
MEAPFHAGARSAYRFTGVLLCITILCLPFGLYILSRAKRCKVVVGPDGVTCKSVFSSCSFAFAEVRRLGVLTVPIHAVGLAGHFARKKVGGGDALHLCAQTADGKTRRFLVSMYENHQQIVDAVSQRCNLPVETLKMGAFGPKWAPAA